MAAIIWADGTYDDSERDAVAEIAEAFELDAAALDKAVDAAASSLKEKDEKEVNACLDKCGAGVPADERGQVFEAFMTIALADGVLTRDEAAMLLSLADSLSLPASEAVVLLCDMMLHEDPELFQVVNE